MHKMEIDENIIDYYNKGNEKNRLDDHNSLERIRTLDILSRYLPKTNATIVDIGGGAGIYSFILSAQGYNVHLLDAITLHIEQATELNNSAVHKLKSIRVGDAKKVPFNDNFADIVLFFGPLYHLTNKKDRIQALQEAYRILKPGGKIFSVGITKFASLLDGFANKFILDPIFQQIVMADLKNGQHRNPSNVEHYFTTAYFHDPNELLIEHVDTGFNELKLIAIEGPFGHINSINEFLKQSDQLKLFLEFSRKIEKEMTLMGSSSHIMVIAEK